MPLTGMQTLAYLMNSRTQNNAERGAERAMFFAQNGRKPEQK
jgi:hypothetical protein